jgi:shikimate dehydrogenase
MSGSAAGSMSGPSSTLARVPGFCLELVGSMSEGAAGNPTGVMIEAAFEHHGLAWRYVNMEVAAAELADAVRGSRAMGFRGFNCSMPHKVAVIDHLDALAPSASVIGAVNCVVRDGDSLIGHNTDGEGFLRALRERVDVRGARVLVLGAGGAARAIAVELALAGAAQIGIVNRDNVRGKALTELITVNTPCPAAFTPWVGDIVVPPGTDVLVNATSVGLYAPDDRPAVDVGSLGNATLVADVVFNPVDTRLLGDAAAQGCQTLDGLGMLVHQGAAAIERWAGVSPDRGVMRDALAAALAQ